MRRTGKPMLAWVFALMVVSRTWAGPYVAPSEGPVPFRRDRVPLPAYEMTDISKQLLGMAGGFPAEGAVERRAVAQMLAVAIALDPRSEDAARMMKELPDRDEGSGGDAKNKAMLCGALWRVVHWLETPEAGIDGQALAACFKDILVVVDAKHPRAAALRDIGEQAEWGGWVPSVSAYEEKLPERRDVAEKHALAGEELPKVPDKPSEPPGKAGIRLAAASLPVLLWKESREGSDEWRISKEEIAMKAYLRSKPEGDEAGDEEVPFENLHISVGSWGDNEKLHAVAQRVEQSLRTRYPGFPKGLTIEFRHDGLDRSLTSRHRHALSAVLAVLADSALSGVESSALVLGVLDENGKVTMPTDFWSLLHPMREMTGLRIIVPKSAEATISAFLAYERPDFLLKNEVWMADTMEDLLALSAKSPAPAIAGVSAKFREIQQRQGVQDVRVYVGNSFVRQRLVALYQEDPRHLSAKLLAIQSAGKRPVTVTRAVMASELKGALGMVGWVRNRESFAPGNKDLGKAHDDVKLAVDRLVRYVEKPDQDLLDAAMRCLAGLRDMDRTSRKRADYWEVESEMREKKRVFDQGYDDFQKMTDQVLESLR